MTEIPMHPRASSRSGWSPGEISLLQTRLREAGASGGSLREVFEEVARRTGRKPNSVRNYYYTQLRADITRDAQGLLRRERPQFVPFAPAETRRLLREVLTGLSRGESVRACTLRLAEGNRSRMLRYQNKYRSLLSTHPDLVREVAAELRREGIPVKEDLAPPPQQNSLLAGIDIRSLLPGELGDLLPEGMPEVMQISSIDLPALIQGLRSLLALAVAGELAARRMEEMKAELARLRRQVQELTQGA